MDFRPSRKPNGVCAVTGSSDGPVHLWAEPAAAEKDKREQPYLVEKNKLDGHTDQVSVVHADFDTEFAVSGSLDGSLRVWSIGGHYCSCQAHLEGHRSSVRALVADIPNGLAVSGGADESLRVWCVNTDSGSSFLIGMNARGRSTSRPPSAGARSAVSSSRNSHGSQPPPASPPRSGPGSPPASDGVPSELALVEPPAEDSTLCDGIFTGDEGGARLLGELEAPGGAVRELAANFAIGRATAVLRGGRLCCGTFNTSQD